MNLAGVPAILDRAEALGVLDDVRQVLTEAHAFERLNLHAYALCAMQAAFILSRTTDRDMDSAAADLLTSAATALSLEWRNEIWVAAAVRA